MGLCRIIHDDVMHKIDAEEKLRSGNLTHEGVYHYTLLATGDKKRAEEVQAKYILAMQEKKEGY